MRRVSMLLGVVLASGCGGSEAESAAAIGQALSPRAAEAGEAMTASTHGHRAKPPHQKPDPKSAPAAAIGFSATQQSGAFASAFSIDATAEVQIAVDWRSLTGSHTQRIDLVDPSGLAYGSIATPFAIASPASASEAQAIQQADGSYRVWATFFIWGTPVEMYRMVGNWTVSVSLDGGAPVATSTLTLT